MSTLNRKRKSLKDKGESGTTLEAIADYAREFKPTLILLENLKNAPWEKRKSKSKSKTTEQSKEGGQSEAPAQGEQDDDAEQGDDVQLNEAEQAQESMKTEETVASYFSELYAVKHLPLDTKDFWLPHTRQRGYMLLVLKSLYEDEAELNAAINAYGELVEKMKKGASAPIEAFLLKSDDYRLRVRSKQSSAKSGKRVAWDKCQVGHALLRGDQGLGIKRPVTHWTHDAPTRNPDFHIDLPEQSDRVSDTRDIGFLRSVNRGIDDRYYR